jgi:hypothetical protein
LLTFFQIREHPLEILNCGTRYGYLDLAGEAAPLTISLPHNQIARSLNFEILQIWVSALMAYAKLTTPPA